MSYRTLCRLVVASIAVVLAGVALAPPVVADHGEGHNGETLELSKSEGLVDGEVVTVTLTSWLPGKTVTVVTCYIFPAAGPGDCELSNYGTHTTVIGDDGTGTLEYPVSVVPGRCDETTPCLVVGGDGFGANANYAAQQITFAATAAAEPEPAEETTEPEPEPAEETTEPEPEPAEETTEPEPEPAEEPATVAAEPEPAEETTEPAPAGETPEPAEEMAEPEPAEEPATVAAEPEPAEETAASEAVAVAEADDDGGGGSVWVWLLPVAALVLALVARLLMRRRSAA